MYKVGHIYSVNYKDEQQKWVAFYAYITRVSLVGVTYVISAVFADTDNNVLTSIMDADLEVEWSFNQLKATDPIRVKAIELKQHGRCKECGLAGDMIRTALVCRRHGFYAGF